MNRLDMSLRALLPCYRDPWAPNDGRIAPDGKVYPVGERWEWRRIAIRHEAIGAILEVDPIASVRVVRDVLARFGHRVSHEQVRADIAIVRGRRPGLVESRRWMPVEEWRDETARRRAARRARRHWRAPAATRPTSATGRDGAAVELAVERRPEPVHPPAPRPRDDWAVWDAGTRRR